MLTEGKLCCAERYEETSRRYRPDPLNADAIREMAVHLGNLPVKPSHASSYKVRIFERRTVA